MGTVKKAMNRYAGERRLLLGSLLLNVINRRLVLNEMLIYLNAHFSYIQYYKCYYGEEKVLIDRVRDDTWQKQS